MSWRREVMMNCESLVEVTGNYSVSITSTLYLHLLIQATKPSISYEIERRSIVGSLAMIYFAKRGVDVVAHSYDRACSRNCMPEYKLI
jgi:hypothetical protein